MSCSNLTPCSMPLSGTFIFDESVRLFEGYERLPLTIQDKTIKAILQNDPSELIGFEFCEAVEELEFNILHRYRFVWMMERMYTDESELFIPDGFNRMVDIHNVLLYVDGNGRRINCLRCNNCGKLLSNTDAFCACLAALLIRHCDVVDSSWIRNELSLGDKVSVCPSYYKEQFFSVGEHQFEESCQIVTLKTWSLLSKGTSYKRLLSLIKLDGIISSFETGESVSRYQPFFYGDDVMLVLRHLDRKDTPVWSVFERFVEDLYDGSTQFTS